MMKLEKKSDLRPAFILLKCSKNNHDDCRMIRDELIESLSNVQEAYTTNSDADGEQWCVAASALIDSSKKEQIEKRLWDLHTKGSDPITIKNLRLLVDDQ